MTDVNVIILMATYNGGTYLREQFKSLLGQSHGDFLLLVRDDGSTDNTLSIIKEISEQDNRVQLVLDSKKNIFKACGNFSILFEHALEKYSFKYLMFCDQDDIWIHDKVFKSLNKIKDAEANKPNRPILIYGDLQPSDESAIPLTYSLKLKKQLKMSNLISFNYAYGCTMLMNYSMAKQINRIPPDSENHDYWIALVACIYESHFIDEKLLLYRQHQFNASGNIAGSNTFLSRIKRRVLNNEKESTILKTRLTMLSRFFRLYGDKLHNNDRLLLSSYLKSYDKGALSVVGCMLQNKIFREGILQTLASFYQTLLYYKKIKGSASI